MKKQTSFGGRYLVTHENPMFGDDPEIFLLLDDVDPIRAICVNKYRLEKNEETGESEVVTTDRFSDIFARYGSEYFSPNMNLPVLNGGPINPDEFYVLHTNYEGAKPHESHGIGLYNISTLENFASTITKDRKPLFAVIVSGTSEVDTLTITMAIFVENWKIYTGLHFMTYAPMLHLKIEYVDLIKAPNRTDYNVGGFDLGQLLNTVFDWSTEAFTSMFVIAAHELLSNETDLNSGEITEVTRAYVAVSETESTDLQMVMKKYTHTEIMEKLEEFREGGKIFKMLEDFDKRQAMLTNLGINPLYYHYSVLTLSFELGKKETDQPTQPRGQKKLSGRAKLYARTLVSLARIIRGRKGS